MSSIRTAHCPAINDRAPKRVVAQASSGPCSSARQRMCQLHSYWKDAQRAELAGVSAGRFGDVVPIRQAPRFASILARAYGPGTSYDTSQYKSAGGQGQYGSNNSMGRQNSNALASVDNSNGALKAKEQPKTAQVRFWLKFHVDYGQSIRIIGGHDAFGAWNLSKAPLLRWSEGDLWNVTLELAAGGVYEYKYVVVEGDGTTAASWQRGANNVLALQMQDEEVEVYDNWKNAPGALVLVDGQETTRERKLLAWAGDMTVQRGELRRTRMELAQAREEIRVLRAELSVLRMEVSEANIARAAAEARQLDLERANSALRLEVAASQATARSTMQEAVRLLNTMSDDDADASSSNVNGITSAALPSASYVPAGVPPPSSSGNGNSQYSSGSYSPSNSYSPSSTYNSSSNGSSNGNGTASNSNGGGGGGNVFSGLFGFQIPGSNGRANSKVAGDSDEQFGPRPSSAASAVVAAAAAMAAAADPRRHTNSSSSAAGAQQVADGTGSAPAPQQNGNDSSKAGLNSSSSSSGPVSASAKPQ